MKYILLLVLATVAWGQDIPPISVIVPGVKKFPAYTCLPVKEESMPGVTVYNKRLHKPRTDLWIGFWGSPYLGAGWDKLQVNAWVSADDKMSWTVCNPSPQRLESGERGLFFVAKREPFLN